MNKKKNTSFFLVAMAVAVMVVSCSKEEAPPASEGTAKTEVAAQKGKEPIDHETLENKDKCWECHEGLKDIMHGTEQKCPTCHHSTKEWIVNYDKIKGAGPASTPQEGEEAFRTWGEMAADGEKFEYSETKVSKWEEKLSKLGKVCDLPKGEDGSIPFEEGDAIYIKRQGREDPVYKAVVKIFAGKPKRVLFSLDDDFGKIMEEPILANKIEDPTLKEMCDFGYLERGGAKAELKYAKYLIEIEEDSIAHPGKKIKKIIVDPSAKDYIYSGDVALGIDSDF